MKIKIPRIDEIDIDNVPGNFEDKVQNAFKEYTEMTNPDFMYHDKLCFIDSTIEMLHKVTDAEDAVNNLIHEYLDYELKENGNIPDKDDYLDIPFMEYCYEQGRKDSRLYSYDYATLRKDNEKIMKILCRIIKAVMDYEWENDGC